MPDFALEVEHVFKKFKKGEVYDSLRDLVPALTARMMKGRQRNALHDREFWALQDVCFQVARAEAFGIIGANGAGKSTILKLLSGIMQPTKGVIQVNGRLSGLIEVGAGFHPDLTGRENIFLNGTILGMSRKEIEERFEQIVEFSGLSDFIDTPVKRYSSGMFARLGFSVAAHVDPDILIVDEVLSVGDFVFQKKCVEHMAQVIRSGVTVIFISHNLQAVRELCTRALLLDRGQVLTVGPTDDVIETYLNGVQERRSQSSDRDLFISSVRVRGNAGLQNHFQPGERAYVDVEVGSRDTYDRLAVGLKIKNADFLEIFHTSTERLGAGSFSLGARQGLTCTFTLDLHLVAGTYYLTASIHRYDIQKRYDYWESAETFFVSEDRDVGGIVNLYPDATIGKLEER